MNIIELAKQADAYADAMDIGGKNYVGLRDERFAALVRNETLEEAAVVCDVTARYEDWELLGGAEGKELCNALAAAIRALKERT